MSQNQSSKPSIGIVDYGLGNTGSVRSSLERVGAEVVISKEPEVLLANDGLVLPGQGAFRTGMENIKSQGLLDTLNRFKDLGKPVLGICLGMQLFFESSTEGWPDGSLTPGLGWIEGEVVQLDSGHPNVGWIEVEWERGMPLATGFRQNSAFYHMHRYVCRPADEQVVVGRSLDEPVYVSAVQQDNLYGVQFHPEKSSISPGLVVMKNFVSIASSNQQ